MSNHKSGGEEISENKKKKNGGCLLFVLVILCVLFIFLAWKFKDNGGTTQLINNETTQITTIETVTETESETKDPLEIILNGEVPTSHSINVEAVLQNPELPTGCEITSLTTVLNYWGYDVD
ncbi:MAG: C39 family peptidase, partial [Ruminococcus callidus]|nr:C39 family peptidase [Ruminococcus callidus]